MTNVKKEMPTMKTNNSQLKAVRRIPIRFRAFLFSAALIGIAIEISFGQPSFTAIGEIKVSQAQVEESETQIAIQQNGTCWVLWSQASQFLTPDLKLDGQNSTRYRFAQVIHSQSDSTWGCIVTKGSHTMEPPFIIELNASYYLMSHNRIINDTIVFLFPIRFLIQNNPGYYRDDKVISVQSQSSGNQSMLCYNYSKNSYMASITDSSTEHAFVGYNSAIGKFSGFRSEKIYKIFPFERERNQFTLSRIHQDKMALLVRRRANVLKENGLDYPYHRFIGTISSAGDSLTPEVFVDAVAHSNADFAERVLLGDNNDVFLFRMHQPKSDSLFVLHAAIDGSFKTQDKFLFHQVARSGLYANYEVGNLSRDRFIIVWTEVDTSRKRSQALCAVYDKNMNRISTVTRLSSDTSGSSFAISMALKGDSIYTAWIDTRNGEKHVFMRMFTPDQLTTTETIAQPTAFGLLRIYPNPILAPERKIWIDISVDVQTEVFVLVSDIYGRIIAIQQMECSAIGEETISFDCAQFRSGVYFITVRTKTTSRTKPFLVLEGK